MNTPAEPQVGDQGPDTVLADLRASVADMRATARWITAAAAGVGALVLAGGPLVVVKDLDDAGDVVAAVGGMLLAVVGVVWVVWRASEVLSPRTATLDDLGSPELNGLRKLIDRSPADFYGPHATGPAELRRERRLRLAVAARLESLLARESDPARVRVLTHEAAVARRNAQLIQRLQQRLLAWIHAWQVRQSLVRARRDTLLASLLILTGAVLCVTAPLDAKEKPTVVYVCGTGATAPPKGLHVQEDPCAR
ncbi:hypothetical protein [Streptomyces paludis]|uniref:Uncharacterized protein n=1 Tax=Streptomyces paludis TaxID=2282738 RepID=A0A345HRS0_9ACTN|nr:hypothetical protein [Streptomyces paludis]AXG79394.1 hypothetical protein DVK44_19010 [Streptomyces paludis]